MRKDFLTKSFLTWSSTFKVYLMLFVYGRPTAPYHNTLPQVPDSEGYSYMLDGYDILRGLPDHIREAMFR